VFISLIARAMSCWTQTFICAYHIASADGAWPPSASRFMCGACVNALESR